MWKASTCGSCWHDGSVTERDALDFVQQMARRPQHAHETGVVHRDIKPENVLVDSLRTGAAGGFRPGDPGRSRAATSRNPMTTGWSARSATWLPNRSTMPQAVDHRADIYSTGVVFYEMLAHELPGPDGCPPREKRPLIPGYDPIVLRAIEHERDRRYQQAQL